MDLSFGTKKMGKTLTTYFEYRISNVDDCAVNDGQLRYLLEKKWPSLTILWISILVLIRQK